MAQRDYNQLIVKIYKEQRNSHLLGKIYLIICIVILRRDILKCENIQTSHIANIHVICTS